MNIIIIIIVGFISKIIVIHLIKIIIHNNAKFAIHYQDAQFFFSKCVLRSLWQKGIAESLQSDVLAKFTVNGSESLTRWLQPGFRGNILLFFTCFVHFREKSKHLFSLHSDNIVSPHNYNAVFQFSIAILIPGLQYCIAIQNSKTCSYLVHSSQIYANGFSFQNIYGSWLDVSI